MALPAKPELTAAITSALLLAFARGDPTLAVIGGSGSSPLRVASENRDGGAQSVLRLTTMYAPPGMTLPKQRARTRFPFAEEEEEEEEEDESSDDDRDDQEQEE